jgi:hypothetical protein
MVSFRAGLIARSAMADTTPPNTLRALPGAFALSGEDMTVVTGYAMQAGAGAFALAGQSATLTPPVVASGTTLDGTAGATGPGAGITLSNGNLTATGSGTNTTARSLASHATGKYYCEFTVAVAGNLIVGYCSTAHDKAQYVGQTSDSGGASSFQTTWFASAPAGITTCPILVAGHTYGIAVDLGTNSLWCIDWSIGSPLWNSNATANPATGVNACTFTGIFVPIGTVPAHVAITPGGATDAVTFNFGPSYPSSRRPSGYFDW